MHFCGRDGSFMGVLSETKKELSIWFQKNIWLLFCLHVQEEKLET